MDQTGKITIVKVPLEPDKASALKTLADERGVSRAVLCGEVLIRYLDDGGKVPHEPAGVPLEGTAPGTKREDEPGTGYHERITFLEGERDRLIAELEERIRDKEIMQHQLSAALSKIPAQIPASTEEKPSWWSRLFRGGKG